MNFNDFLLSAMPYKLALVSFFHKKDFNFVQISRNNNNNINNNGNVGLCKTKEVACKLRVVNIFK